MAAPRRNRGMHGNGIRTLCKCFDSSRNSFPTVSWCLLCKVQRSVYHLFLLVMYVLYVSLSLYISFQPKRWWIEDKWNIISTG